MSATGDIFAAALNQFGVTTARKTQNAFVFATEEVLRSVTDGSELTGSPGQPVQTANLYGSYITGARFLSRGLWEVTTNVDYAIYIEHGGNDIGPFTLRSEVGGWHSLKLTEASWDRIAAFAALKASGNLSF